MIDRLVITDLDGPVLDGRQRHYACYSDILREVGGHPLPLPEYWKLKRERTPLAEQLARSGATAYEHVFRREWLARIESPRMLALDRVQPGAVATLDAWRDRGFEVVLATQRRNASALQEQLADLGIRHRFDRLAVSSTTEKASAVRAALSVPDASVRAWIGDTEVDVVAARAMNCPAWVVSCGLRSEAFLRSLSPDRVFSDLSSVEL